MVGEKQFVMQEAAQKLVKRVSTCSAGRVICISQVMKITVSREIYELDVFSEILRRIWSTFWQRSSLRGFDIEWKESVALRDPLSLTGIGIYRCISMSKPVVIM